MYSNKHFGNHKLVLFSLVLLVAILLAACGTAPKQAPAESTQPAKATAETKSEAATPAAKEEEQQPAKEVVLDIMASQQEYLNAERQIWDIYEAEHPGVKINLFAINEDQEAAFEAKMAGGYVPAMIVYGTPVDASNYKNFVNLLDVDFKWFDRWQYDVRHAEENLTGVPGVYTLDPYQGYFFTWMYHADLMDELGLDPRAIKTQADLTQFLADCTEAVSKRDDIDYCWDQSWHNWVWAANYWNMMPLAYEDGGRDRQRESWLGKIQDPAQDPFRHTFQWFKDAYQAGWMPKEFWLREWETDMEASFIAKKSLLMLHGPWPWDKMMAADPSAKLLGIPSTPPEKEGDPWMQSMGPLNLTAGYRIPIANMDKPEWPQILDAYNWWFSPEVVKMRAEVHGTPLLYKLDEPLELQGPQWLGIIKEFEPGGLYENVVIETSPTGSEAVAKYKKEGAGEFWDWQWNDVWAKVVQDEMSVDDAVKWFHDQVAQDYDLP